MPTRIILIFAFSLLLTACGGGGDSSTDTGGSTDSGVTDNGNTDNGSSTPTEFVEADGNASYTGSREWSNLSEQNVLSYLSLLFAPGYATPNLALRSQEQSTKNFEPDHDFLRAQDKLLHTLKQEMLKRLNYANRAVNHTVNTCENSDGSIRVNGDLDDVTEKGQLDLQFDQCQYQGYLYNGNAYLLIYETNGSFSELSSITLSYNGMEISSAEGVFQLTGTLDEVYDYNTGSVRNVALLHRYNYTNGTQDLTDTARWFYNFDSSVDITGTLYHATQGRARLTTQQPMIYNSANKPISGILNLTSSNGSKIRLTFLGLQYNDPAAPFLLQYDIDSNGDDFYESTAVLNENQF